MLVRLVARIWKYQSVTGMPLVPRFEPPRKSVADTNGALLAVLHSPVEPFRFAIDCDFLVTQINVVPLGVRAFAVAETDSAKELDNIPLIFVCELKKRYHILRIISLRGLFFVCGPFTLGNQVSHPVRIQKSDHIVEVVPYRAIIDSLFDRLGLCLLLS